MADLARWGKECNSNADVSVKQPPSKEAETGPFVLGETLPVVPACLVKKIQRGEYVDMEELLKDNIEVERCIQEVPASRMASRWEIPDMLSWLHCYSLYAAIICSQYPQKARELWAYQATLIGEAKKCGGCGWYLYDAAFQQQMVSVQDTDFSKLKDSLYSVTFLRKIQALPELYAVRSLAGVCTVSAH